jgi:hypothetical protein
MSTNIQGLLERQQQVKDHPCSWCARSRSELPEGAQYLAVLMDERSDTVELACDDCLANVAGDVLKRFTTNRQTSNESEAKHQRDTKKLEESVSQAGFGVSRKEVKRRGLVKSGKGRGATYRLGDPDGSEGSAA